LGADIHLASHRTLRRVRAAHEKAARLARLITRLRATRGGFAAAAVDGRPNLGANFGAFRQNLFAAREQYGLECFDAVVSRLEKEILDHRLGALQLRDEHLCVNSGRHHAADLGGGSIPDWFSEHDHRAAFARLREIVR